MVLSIDKIVSDAIQQADAQVNLVEDALLLEPSYGTPATPSQPPPVTYTQHECKIEFGQTRNIRGDNIIQGDALIWVDGQTLPEGIQPYTGWSIQHEGTRYEILNGVTIAGFARGSYRCDCKAYPAEPSSGDISIALNPAILSLSADAHIVSYDQTVETNSAVFTLNADSHTVVIGGGNQVVDVNAATFALVADAHAVEAPLSINVNSAAIAIGADSHIVEAPIELEANPAIFTLLADAHNVTIEGGAIDIAVNAAVLALAADSHTVEAPVILEVNAGIFTIVADAHVVEAPLELEVNPAILALTADSHTVEAPLNVDVNAATLALTADSHTVAVDVSTINLEYDFSDGDHSIVATFL